MGQCGKKWAGPILREITLYATPPSGEGWGGEIAFALLLVGARALNRRPCPTLIDMIKKPAPPPDDNPHCCLCTQLFDKCQIIKHAFPKKRKSSMTVNNNAGQRLNLRDVYKVMEMRDCPAQSDTSGHPFIDHKNRLG